MNLDLAALISFAVAAVLLLGSPGPGIAALVAAARRDGFVGSLRFYGGLQLGLALVAALCAGGLFSLLQAAPLARQAMSLAAAGYLAYLAYRVATAPVGAPAGADDGPAATALGGFVLGVTNPKAYVAMASLMAAYGIARDRPQLDAALKWSLCVAVVLVVDLIWLWLGGVLGAVRLGRAAERGLNVAMGLAILAAALAALV